LIPAASQRMPPLLPILLQLEEPASRYTGGGVPKGAVLLVVLALLYVLPTLLAWVRRSRRRWRITAINLLLGWTIVGWIAAAIMTFAYEPPPEGEADVPYEPGTRRRG
jgi:hypothetical protein